MDQFKIKAIKGLYLKYKGLCLQREAELEVYLNTPVGIGDHGCLTDVVEDKMKKTI